MRSSIALLSQAVGARAALLSRAIGAGERPLDRAAMDPDPEQLTDQLDNIRRAQPGLGAIRSRDSYKTELIADRVWRTHAQLEIATVDYVAWFNTRRLQSSLGNRPPTEHEQRHVAALAADPEALLLPAGSVHP